MNGETLGASAMPNANTHRPKADWLIPAGLIALSFIPVTAGIVRLVHLAGSAPVSVEDARFFTHPAPVVLHLFAVTVYCLLGAFQFSPGSRRRHRAWHRAAGRVLVPTGLIAALSGLWMTQFYLHISTDSLALYLTRLVVGGAMTAALLLAVSALRRRDFQAHGAWMIRAYALGQGAGTQALTQAPWLIFVGPQQPVDRAVLMAAGWLINIAFAEWVIRRGVRRPQPVLAA
jgi:uncharacterized membrane protein